MLIRKPADLRYSDVTPKQFYVNRRRFLAGAAGSLALGTLAGNARAGMKLKVAAKVDNADKKYFETEIKPLLSQGHVEFIGEIDDSQKPAFLSGAHALLFPIDWPEPFGLVMIESMACGTPVIAFNCGSVPEVMDDGLTGFIVSNEDEAVAAIDRLGELDRAKVRLQFDRRFTARRMAQDYLDLYGELCQPVAPRLRAVAG